MSRTAIILGVSAIYLVICLVVGLIPGRRGGGTADAYVAGDRGLGLVLLYFIMGGTVFSSFAFLGLRKAKVSTLGSDLCQLLRF